MSVRDILPFVDAVERLAVHMVDGVVEPAERGVDELAPDDGLVAPGDQHRAAAPGRCAALSR